MNRVYPSRIEWENEPSTNTPINETNLNKMDYAIYEIDGRVVTFDLTKANQSDLLQTVKNVTYDTETGIFTFTFWNGSTVEADLNIEKIPVSFRLTEQGVLIMTTADGTEYRCDIAALIKIYTFADSTEIDFATTTDASGNKTITAQIKAGSITGDKLQPNYLADCVAAKNGAETAESNAQGYVTDANAEALKSEGYAVGKQNGTDVPSTSPYYHNNAKWYSEQANPTTLANLTDTDIDNPQANQPLSYDGENWINNPNLMLVSSSEKTSWNGAVSKITENEQSGYLKSKNLLSGIENGTINSSGADIANIQYARNVGFIPVISGKTYTMSLTPTGGKTIRISTNLFASLTSGVTQELALQNDAITFTVPDGINYVRFVYFTTGTKADNPEQYISNAQFEEGSTATAYIQYAPSNIELDNKKADITSIGTDESGRTTASKAYAIGEHFYKDGKFCTAKAAIASGATFTLNTNYVEGTVADEFLKKKDVYISKYQSDGMISNKWYKLFEINYPNNAYNYINLRFNLRRGYYGLHDCWLSVRYEPNGLNLSNTYLKGVTARPNDTNNIMLYQIDSKTIALAIRADGNYKTGFEIIDFNAQAGSLADNVIIPSSFVELSEAPTSVGNVSFI